jgi:ATP-dependent DNA ligase
MLQNFRSAASRIHYFVFDLLVYDGRDLTRLPLFERHEIMRSVLKFGSVQEFDGACILSRFLKNDKFCFCDRHALRLEQ